MSWLKLGGKVPTPNTLTLSWALLNVGSDNISRSYKTIWTIDKFSSLIKAVREASDPDYHTLGPEERKYTINKITVYNCLKIYKMFLQISSGGVIYGHPVKGLVFLLQVFYKTFTKKRSLKIFSGPWEKIMESVLQRNSSRWSFSAAHGDVKVLLRVRMFTLQMRAKTRIEIASQEWYQEHNIQDITTRWLI